MKFPDFISDYIGKIDDLIQFVIYLIALLLFIQKLSSIFIRLLLGFSKDEVVNVIITTSEIKEDNYGSPVRRATTGIGQILGISIASKLIGRIYNKKSISVYFSEFLGPNPPTNGDVILLGGPGKNSITKIFLAKFQKDFPNFNFKFDDQSSYIKLNKFIVSQKDLNLKDGNIDKDYAVVICMKNPLSNKSRRIILCAGLTSYGTAGGAIWLFENVLTNNLKIIKTVIKLSKILHPTSFVAIVEVDILKGTIMKSECKQLVPLD